ncbi:HdeD family acid-resistance protein [Nakamurella flavida]|uniref:HdeD family acid-resistance protein n=1 Tax=Nakamurella flavida TaxID=363630 RepID=A0A938YRQ3_9ACTN|nr:HdeD family acid-resistance protein [Nakamurella flavida]MBM9477998.1 HdeD family acid-resistance protein [Nakamurella flavida]MDP9778286.1 uncharacterized membrane protein HdeD (DUF308 family) [Nakamurella flavida]
MTSTLDLGPGLGAFARQYWWLLLARGVGAVVFGVLAIGWPGITVLAIVFVFAIYAFLDGIASIVMALSEKKAGHKWGWSVFTGVVSILAGVVAIAWPVITAVALLYVIAFWALLAGFTSIAGALALRKAGFKQWVWTMVFGVCAVIFGISLLVNPGRGILSVLWVVGVFAVVGGISLAVASFTVRRFGRASTPAAA